MKTSGTKPCRCITFLCVRFPSGVHLWGILYPRTRICMWDGVRVRVGYFTYVVSVPLRGIIRAARSFAGTDEDVAGDDYRHSVLPLHAPKSSRARSN